MVDTKQLLGGVVGLGGAFLAITFLVIMFDQLGQTPNLSNDALQITGNSTTILGSVVTTWGSILVLGLIILSAFIAILGALIFLANRQGR